jgi:hypothetical protein
MAPEHVPVDGVAIPQPDAMREVPPGAPGLTRESLSPVILKNEHAMETAAFVVFPRGPMSLM